MVKYALHIRTQTMCHVINFSRGQELDFVSVSSELEEDIRSIGQFNTEIVVEATARCLKAINPDIDAPLAMPPSMSVRFRIGASLAQACQV
jgi:Protein of unknown function (DUF812)